ncbi:MAG: hypothetical protein HZB41_03505 [Ignavibacteriae bacterium]|nr:hypothetical protein [Ignavibacteriota bacterium]
MKYIVLISTCLLIIILTNSCEDSFGIEKNVLITKKNDTSGIDTTGKDTIQKVEASIDSVIFIESYFYNGYPNEFPIKVKIISQVAYVDTSVRPIFIWVDLDIRNQNGDDIYTPLGRNEYTQSIRFTADSLQGIGPFRLIGSPSSGYWSELGIRNIEKQDSTFLSGSQSGFEIQFRFDYENQISAIIFADIPNPSDPNNPTHLFGTFVIKYPK